MAMRVRDARLFRLLEQGLVQIDRCRRRRSTTDCESWSRNWRNARRGRAHSARSRTPVQAGAGRSGKRSDGETETGNAAGSAARGDLAGATLPGKDDFGVRAKLQNPFHPAALRFHLTAPLPHTRPLRAASPILPSGWIQCRRPMRRLWGGGKEFLKRLCAGKSGICPALLQRDQRRMAAIMRP